MNDFVIRKSFHEKRLRRYHENSETLVIDELGIKHGKCRADIAVINGSFMGFEIKGQDDSLFRLPIQITAYNTVFDRIAIIIAERHLKKVQAIIPKWWGVIMCKQYKRGGLTFTTRRKAMMNPLVDPFALAELLWRSEAAEILLKKGEPCAILRKPRAFLYSRLVMTMTRSELSDRVRSCLLHRKNWRDLKGFSEGDDLCLPIAKW